MQPVMRTRPGLVTNAKQLEQENLRQLIEQALRAALAEMGMSPEALKEIAQSLKSESEERLAANEERLDYTPATPILLTEQQVQRTEALKRSRINFEAEQIAAEQIRANHLQDLYTESPKIFLAKPEKK